jgi:hypothetical protein
MRKVSKQQKPSPAGCKPCLSRYCTDSLPLLLPLLLLLPLS